jgi:hypothetical protein
MRENRPSGLTSGMWKRKLSEFTAPHLDSTTFGAGALGRLHQPSQQCLYLLAGLSVALPKRGLQDRLAGTWPVLR